MPHLPPPSAGPVTSAVVTGTPRRRRRAVPWIACLLATLICAAAAYWRVVTFDVTATDTPSRVNGMVLSLIALTLLTLILLVITLGLLISHLAEIYGNHRRSKGRYTAAERQVIAHHEELQRSLNHGRTMARDLLTGQPSSTISPWDVLLEDGETAFVDCPAGYARYYGTTVSYTQTSGAFVGHPAFVIAGLGVTAISNSSARRRANRMAADQWREHQQVRCLVTDQRILVQRADSQWLSFYYSAMVSMHPFPADGLFFAEYETTSPLRLEGRAAVLAAVATVWSRFGAAGLRDHPYLQCMRLHSPQQLSPASGASDHEPMSP